MSELMKLNLKDEDIIYVNNEKLRYVLSESNLGIHEYAFIGTLTPFITEPNNDIRIYNKYLNLEQIGKIVGISKNIVTRVIKNLEKSNIIRVIKGGNQPPIIYFNPNLFNVNKNISKETFELFTEKIKHSTKQSKEKELEKLLINNLDLIESGMKLIQNQYPVEDGFIDILTRDKNGKLCIIELKVVKDDTKIVHQCVYYPTQFNEKVRVITIAPDYKNSIYKSLKALNVEMKQYKFRNDQLIITNYNK